MGADQWLEFCSWTCCLGTPCCRLENCCNVLCSGHCNLNALTDWYTHLGVVKYMFGAPVSVTALNQLTVHCTFPFDLIYILTIGGPWGFCLGNSAVDLGFQGTYYSTARDYFVLSLRVVMPIFCVDLEWGRYFGF